MSDTWDLEPVVEAITVERDGDWIIVSLDGERVWKRLTRDRAFTRARICFWANRSPSVPKSRRAFETVILLGGWRPGKRAQWYASNSIDIPIPNVGQEPITQTTRARCAG